MIPTSVKKRIMENIENLIDVEGNPTIGPVFRMVVQKALPKDLQETNHSRVEFRKTLSMEESPDKTLTSISEPSGFVKTATDEPGYHHDIAIKTSDGRSLLDKNIEEQPNAVLKLIVENQHLGEQVATLQSLAGDLQREQQLNKQLMMEVNSLKDQLRTSTKTSHEMAGKFSDDGAEDWTDLNSEVEMMFSRSGKSELRQRRAPEKQQSAHLSDRSTQAPHPGWITSRLEQIKNWISEQRADFVEDGVHEVRTEPEEPLSLKTLKENIARFRYDLQLVSNLMDSVNNLASWDNKWTTFITFIVYMYTVYHGMFLMFVTILLLLWLTANLIKPNKYGLLKLRQQSEDGKEDNSLKDKYYLVLQVAQKVQNTSGNLADIMEKCFNLFYWHHMQATKSLYLTLFGQLVGLAILPFDSFCLLGGWALGIKVFVIEPIFSKFPKVRVRYDMSYRLWKELPRFADLMKPYTRAKSAVTVTLQDPPGENLTTTLNAAGLDLSREQSHRLSNIITSSLPLYERFSLPEDEVAFNGLSAEGWRCTLMNKDNFWSNMKHGKLFLTKNYLCFEQTLSLHKGTLVFPLSDIVELQKIRQFSLLPGTGMTMELQVKGFDKSLLFSAMPSRDEAYESIIAAGLVANLPFAVQSKIN